MSTNNKDTNTTTSITSENDAVNSSSSSSASSSSSSSTSSSAKVAENKTETKTEEPEVKKITMELIKDFFKNLLVYPWRDNGLNMCNFMADRYHNTFTNDFVELYNAKDDIGNRKYEPYRIEEILWSVHKTSNRYCS